MKYNKNRVRLTALFNNMQTLKLNAMADKILQFLEGYIKAEKVTALFNNMRTLKFKSQPTNAFFATVNQMFGGSSQLPTMLSELYSPI